MKKKLSKKISYNIIELNKEDLNYEYSKRGIFYILILWIVSIIAMISNSIRIVYRKIFTERSKSLKKIMWDMGRDKKHFSSIFIDKFSSLNHYAKCEAAGWKSLELFYNYHKKVKSQLKNNFEGKMNRFWMEKMENRQAVVNRLKILMYLLSHVINNYKNKSEIRLLSIASGSAQGVIDIIKIYPKLNIKVLLLDLDSSALDEAKRIVKAKNIDKQFSFVKGSTRDLDTVCKKFRPHIIEMVGFLDYRPKHKAISLIQKIKKNLPDNGIFITCNIKKNREKIFLDWVLLWPMIYRSEKEFAELLIKGGFLHNNINMIHEPFGIYEIATCKK